MIDVGWRPDTWLPLDGKVDQELGITRIGLGAARPGFRIVGDMMGMNDTDGVASLMERNRQRHPGTPRRFHDHERLHRWDLGLSHGAGEAAASQQAFVAVSPA